MGEGSWSYHLYNTIIHDQSNKLMSELAKASKAFTMLDNNDIPDHVILNLIKHRLSRAVELATIAITVLMCSILACAVMVYILFLS